MDRRKLPPENINPRGVRPPVKVSGAEKYNEYLKKEVYRRTHTSKAKGALPLQDLETPLDDKDNLYLVNLDKEEKARKKAVTVRKTLFFLLCFVFSE